MMTDVTVVPSLAGGLLVGCVLLVTEIGLTGTVLVVVIVPTIWRQVVSSGIDAMVRRQVVSVGVLGTVLTATVPAGVLRT